ncbi:hypothetical protein FACS1894124_6630 [Spirochaetia bacterium]|nr:hypothetical protein FACS1894124_6630 [Spirochaetia bacterium]
MEAQFDRARPEDYDEVIDLANYVFSHDHIPLDFPALLPKLYKREYFMDGIHYLAREGGRIKAVIGAYPLEWDFSTAGANAAVNALSGRGIGMVAVHPYSRSKGYMKVLMNMAMADMKKDGMVFSCLGGQRQRYEYFGFTPAGSAYTFECDTANITHTLGREWKSGLSIKQVDSGDTVLLDKIASMHDAKKSRLRRDRKKLFDILSSWKSEVFAVTEGNNFEGYVICKGGGKEVSEINLKDHSRMAEVSGLFLRQKNFSGQGSINIAAGPHEPEKIAALSRFAEAYYQSPAYSFAVFDYQRFADAFIKLKIQNHPLEDGSFVIQIEDKRLKLFVDGGQSGAAETDAPADLKLDPLEAIRFLSSPLEALIHPAVKNNAFLQSLLPLPLFFENVDEV